MARVCDRRSELMQAGFARARVREASFRAGAASVLTAL
jgi:hypothetical protein